jgi:uncharacterized protein YndB with AHSA1/START domain
MARVTEITIERTLPFAAVDVWALICDARRIPEWVEPTLEIKRSSSATLALGVEITERTRVVGPLVFTTTWKVVAFEPPHRQVHAGTVPLARDTVLELRLERANGATRYFHIVRFRPALGPFGYALEPLARREIRRSLERSLDALEQLLARA